VKLTAEMPPIPIDEKGLIEWINEVSKNVLLSLHSDWSPSEIQSECKAFGIVNESLFLVQKSDEEMLQLSLIYKKRGTLKLKWPFEHLRRQDITSLRADMIEHTSFKRLKEMEREGIVRILKEGQPKEFIPDPRFIIREAVFTF
jgi:hypothetical protein